jgi:hypothetical protein
MDGPDLVFLIDLQVGEFLSLALTASWDVGMYVVADCGDVSGTCLAAADEFLGGFSEFLEFEAEQAGTYFLIIDSDGDCGPANLVINRPFPTEGLSWGSVKALFR